MILGIIFRFFFLAKSQTNLRTLDRRFLFIAQIFVGFFTPNLKLLLLTERIYGQRSRFKREGKSIKDYMAIL